MKKFIVITLFLLSCIGCTKEPAITSDYITLSFNPILEGYDMTPKTKSMENTCIDTIRMVLDSIPWDTSYPITLKLNKMFSDKYNYNKNISYTVSDSIWAHGGSIKILKGEYTIIPEKQTVREIITDKKYTTFDKFTISLYDENVNTITINLKSEVYSLFFEKKYNEKILLSECFRFSAEVGSSSLSHEHTIDSTTDSIKYNINYKNNTFGDVYCNYTSKIFHTNNYVIFLIYYSPYLDYISKINAYSKDNNSIYISYNLPQFEKNKIYNIGIKENIYTSGSFNSIPPNSFEEGNL